MKRARRRHRLVALRASRPLVSWTWARRSSVQTSPVTWLPAVEHGVFFPLSEQALEAQEARLAVQRRTELFQQGFATWRKEREDERASAKPDFTRRGGLAGRAC